MLPQWHPPLTMCMLLARGWPALTDEVYSAQNRPNSLDEDFSVHVRLTRTLGCVALLAALFSAQVSAARAADAEPTQHEFIIQNFQTESGAVLPQARVVYGTFGQLNAAGDNAVLLPSHYMA